MLEDERKKRKLYNLLIWCCFIFYNASLISKNIFTAQLVNITTFLNIEKATAQLCSTYYFFPYAIGQLLIVPFIKKLDLKKALLITMVLSGIVICSMTFADSITFFYVAHALNGALQVISWVGALSLCSKHLPSDMLPKANKLLSMGFASGVGLAYALSALMSFVNLWQGTFMVSGILTIVTVVVLFFVVIKVEAIPKLDSINISVENKPVNKEKPCLYSAKKRIILFYAFDIIGCLAVYSIYYSVMPNVTFLFKEVFGMDPSLSILITVCFPIVISFGSILSISLSERFRKYFLVSAILSISAGLIALLLAFTYNLHFLYALILLLVVLVLSRGSSSVLGTIIVLDLRKEIDTGRFSAINNAFASITASVMPPLMASIIPNANPDWQTFFIVCAVLGVVAGGIMVLFNYVFIKKEA